MVMAYVSSGFAKGIFGAAVLSLTFAAVAYGRDLMQQDGNGSLSSSQSEQASTATTFCKLCRTCPTKSSVSNLESLFQPIWPAT